MTVITFRKETKEKLMAQCFDSPKHRTAVNIKQTAAGHRADLVG